MPNQPICRKIAEIHCVGRLMRTQEVMQRLGISRSTLYRWIKKGVFPRALESQGKRLGWNEPDFIAWCNSLK